MLETNKHSYVTAKTQPHSSYLPEEAYTKGAPEAVNRLKDVLRQYKSSKEDYDNA